VVPFTGRVRVVHLGVTVADSTAAIRVLETSQPPAFYLPPGDVDTSVLSPSPSGSWCEWKGQATYWSLLRPERIADVAWSYTSPTEPFAAIAGHLAFYAQKMDECWVDGERVQPNPGWVRHDGLVSGSTTVKDVSTTAAWGETSTTESDTEW
jgi:uncharacterized protein (DUF427 family)